LYSTTVQYSAGSNARHYAIRNVLCRAEKKGKMAPQLECPVELKDGATGRTDICLTEGMEAGIMHLDVVVAAPIQAAAAVWAVTAAAVAAAAVVQEATAVWEVAAAVVQEARADEIFSTFRWYVTVYVLYCKGRSRSVNLLKCDSCCCSYRCSKAYKCTG
jgi:hypothetical protein